MFGFNPVVSRMPWDGKYRVQEVFNTIQGEGPLSGTPALFVRMWGCNLRCHFCDTDFTTSEWSPTLDELVEDIEAKRHFSRWVVITGGEPMLQELGPLCLELIERGIRVQIETAGTVWPSSFHDVALQHALDNRDIVLVCSPKVPKVNAAVEQWCDHYKYIIGADTSIDDLDGLPTEGTQGVRALGHVRLYRPPPDRKGTTIWVQPMDEYNVRTRFDNETGRSELVSFTKREGAGDAAIDRCCQIVMHYGHRLSLQVHKIVGLP